MNIETIIKQIGDLNTKVTESIQNKADAATVTKAVSELTDLKEQLVTLQKQIANGDDPAGRGDGGALKHVGEVVVKSDGYKSFAAGRSDKRASASIIVPTDSLFVQKNTIVGDSSNARVLAPYERRNIVTGVERRAWVLDSIPRSPTAAAAVEYAIETATNNAATQAAGSPLAPAEGALKGQSSFSYSLATTRVLTIANFCKLSVQVMDDAAALSGIIANRLRYFVMVEADRQVIEGAGAAELTGFLTTGNHVDLTGGQTGDTALDSIHRAITQLRENDYMPSVIVMSPTGYQSIALLKDLEERYIVGDPMNGGSPRLWGVDVVLNPAMANDQFIVADMPAAAEFRVRHDAVVEFGYADDDFLRNLVTARAEMRGALCVVRPAGVVVGGL